MGEYVDMINKIYGSGKKIPFDAKSINYRIYTVKYTGIRTPDPVIAWREYNIVKIALRRK